MTMSDIILSIQTFVVFVTLLVLIWQTRENIKAGRISQYQEVLKMMFEYRSDAMNDQDIELPELQENNYFNKVFSEFGVKGYYHKLKLFFSFG